MGKRRWPAFISGVLLLTVVACLARGVHQYSLEELVRKSGKVIVGKIKSVSFTDITRELHYPTVRGTPFVWMHADIEVVEGFKNAVAGQHIEFVFLQVDRRKDGHRAMINGPRLLSLASGDRQYLMFLRETTETNLLCSLSDPYDPVDSVFLLDPKDDRYQRAIRGVIVHSDPETIKAEKILSLMQDKDSLSREGVTAFRQFCQQVATNDVNIAEPIVLTNGVRRTKSGWETDYPDSGVFWSPPSSNRDAQNRLPVD